MESFGVGCLCSELMYACCCVNSWVPLRAHGMDGRRLEGLQSQAAAVANGNALDQPDIADMWGHLPKPK